MFLGSTIDNDKITLVVENKRVKTANVVRLLGITIDEN